MIGLYDTGYTIVTVWRNAEHPPRYYALLPSGEASQWSYDYDQARKLGEALVKVQRDLADAVDAEADDDSYL